MKKSGKEIYMERRRLEAENKLAHEREMRDRRTERQMHQDEAEDLFYDIANSLHRIAEALDRATGETTLEFSA